MAYSSRMMHNSRYSAISALTYPSVRDAFSSMPTNLVIGNHNLFNWFGLVGLVVVVVVAKGFSLLFFGPKCPSTSDGSYSNLTEIGNCS